MSKFFLKSKETEIFPSSLTPYLLLFDWPSFLNVELPNGTTAKEGKYNETTEYLRNSRYKLKKFYNTGKVSAMLS